MDRAGVLTQFLGSQTKWINEQHVPSSEQSFQPQEKGIGLGQVQGTGLQGLGPALYGLRNKHLMNSSPEGETRVTETM